MQYDIFISYSHHDDTAYSGWVQQFQKRLSDYYRTKSGKMLSGFLDKKGLGTGHVLPDQLKEALGKSVLFIPILSAEYLSRPWCRKEFLHFMDAAGDHLINERKCRILPVQLAPFAHCDLNDPDEQREVNRIVGFLKEKEILYADFYEGPLPVSPRKKDFHDKVAHLSEEVFDLLSSWKGRFKKSPLRRQNADGPAIFLGYTANDCKELRDSLLKELRSQHKYRKIPHRILPDDAPDAPADLKSLSATELEDFLRSQLEASDFSIHLFGDFEGPKLADTDERAPHIQYRLAKEIALENPGFVVFTAESESDERAAVQEGFLKMVADDVRRMPQIEELPAFETKAIKDAILEKIEVLKRQEERKSEEPAESFARRVFFVHDHRDKDDPLRNRIDDLIYEQQFDVYVPVFREDDPLIDPDASFRDFWLVCSKALVLLRNASTAWCNAMKVELIKTAIEKKPPYEMAICVAEPDVAQRIRDVRSHEFRIIDCAHEGFEQEIVQFLKAARHA